MKVKLEKHNQLFVASVKLKSTVSKKPYEMSSDPFQTKEEALKDLCGLLAEYLVTADNEADSYYQVVHAISREVKKVNVLGF